MPNRTIYVADTDLPIFEKAQQLAGNNLSSTIAQALRRFVEAEEARANGYEEITISVGKGQPYLQKRFRGRVLAKRRVSLGNVARILTLQVYQTAHGRFALYARNAPNWNWSSSSSKKRDTKYQAPLTHAWDIDVDISWEASGWGAAFEPEERRFDVFENVEALKEIIPEEMYESILRYLQQGDDVEFLDI